MQPAACTTSVRVFAPVAASAAAGAMVFLGRQVATPLTANMNPDLPASVNLAMAANMVAPLTASHIHHVAASATLALTASVVGAVTVSAAAALLGSDARVATSMVASWSPKTPAFPSAAVDASLSPPYV